MNPDNGGRWSMLPRWLVSRPASSAARSRRLCRLAAGLVLGSLLIGVLLIPWAEAAAPLAYGVLDTNTIAVIDTATASVVARVPVGFTPVGIAVHPTGRSVFVSNFGSDAVAVVDTASQSTLGNLALLCGRHHRAVHEEGYQVERASDGERRFRLPNGRLLDEVPAPAPVPADPVGALRAPNDAEGLVLDAHTMCARWLGERFDLGWAISVLHPLARASRADPPREPWRHEPF